MNKITTLLIYFFVINLNAFEKNDKSNSSTVAIPDVAFEQRLIDDGYDTSGILDGLILRMDAEAITGTLNVGYSGTGPYITDLTGIQSMINLTGLSAITASLIGDIQVLDLSQNIALKTLNLYASTNMTTIDLSNNVLLETVILGSAGTNFISINLNNLNNLKVLTIEEADIANLDLSDCVSLETFEIRNLNNINFIDFEVNVAIKEVIIEDCTDLTEINIQNTNNTFVTNFSVTNTPNLLCVLVDNEVFSNTNWTIDSQTTFSAVSCDTVEIPDTAFEQRLIDEGLDSSGVLDGLILRMDAEAITGTLDIGYYSGPYITDLTGIQSMINLTGLSAVTSSLIGDIQILDLSQNIALKTLNLYASTNMTTIDLSNNVLLETVILGSAGTNFISINLNNLNNLKVLTIEEADIANLDLSDCVSLETFEIRNLNNINSIDFEVNVAIKEVIIEDCTDLAEINIQNTNNTFVTNFSVTNTPNLLCVLVDNEVFSNTNWTIDSQTTFSAVSCNLIFVPDDEFEQRLIDQGIDSTGILDDFILEVDALAVTGTLDMSSTTMDMPIFEALGTDAFANITELNFSGNPIGDILLFNSTSLKTLDLSNTNMTEFGLFDLFFLTALEDLNLNDNIISSLDLSIVPTLKTLTIDENTTLTDLDLSGLTNLTLLSAVNSSLSELNTLDLTALTTLDLSLNNITSLNISTNVNLQYLNTSNNNITDLNVSLNTDLKEVYLNDNSIIALNLDSCSLLEKFEIDNNNLNTLSVFNGNNTNITRFLITNNPDLTCVLVDDATYSTTNWIDKDLQTTYNGVSCDVLVSSKVFLQGAFINPNVGEELLMRDDLRIGGYIPTTSPYADAITCFPSVFNSGGTTGTGAIHNDIVDWIYVELRNETDNTIVIDSQSALLQRDGDIVSIDGVSVLTFNQTGGNYYIAIKHRNHLGIMSANTIALSSSSTVLNLTDANNQITFGIDAQTIFGMPSGVVAMWIGDANGDGQLNYLGADSDVPSIRSQVFNDLDNSVFGGPPVATYASIGYYTTDTNMDGFTYYSGALSDVLYIRNNIFNNPSNSVFGGLPVATYLFVQQLPEGLN